MQYLVLILIPNTICPHRVNQKSSKPIPAHPPNPSPTATTTTHNSEFPNRYNHRLSYSSSPHCFFKEAFSFNKFLHPLCILDNLVSVGGARTVAADVDSIFESFWDIHRPPLPVSIMETLPEEAEEVGARGGGEGGRGRRTRRRCGHGDRDGGGGAEEGETASGESDRERRNGQSARLRGGERRVEGYQTIFIML